MGGVAARPMAETRGHGEGAVGEGRRGCKNQGAFMPRFACLFPETLADSFEESRCFTVAEHFIKPRFLFLFLKDVGSHAE